jgi:hypothetical protein
VLGPTKSIKAVELQTTIKPDGDVEITATSHGLENAISFNVVTGEIEIDTSKLEHVHGQSVAVEITTTLTSRREPTNQCANAISRRLDKPFLRPNMRPQLCLRASPRSTMPSSGGGAPLGNSW